MAIRPFPTGAEVGSALTDQVLAELGAAEKPVLYVFSKIDQLPAPELEALRVRIGNLLPNSVFVSAMTE